MPDQAAGELTSRTAGELVRLIRGRRATCEDVTQAFLDRIADVEPEVRAWAHVDPEGALEQARLCDAIPREAALRGIPVGVKDNIDTYDMPTRYGAAAYGGHHPRDDATAAALLRGAGAVILGKTVTTEFAAHTNPAATRSPYDPARTPGGSSSGSAAAVATGMAPAALGTQTGGSVVRPASYCGIFGFKPTFGLIDRAGVWPVAKTLDTLGVLARGIDDAELVARATAGANWDGALPPAAPVRGPRVAILRTTRWHEADRSIRDAIEAVALRLEMAGAEVEELELPEYEAMLDVAITILRFEMGRTLAEEADRRPADLDPLLLEAVQDARRASPDEYQAALARVDVLRRAADELLSAWSCVLTPSVRDAPPARESTGDPLFCRIWTLLGTPALSVPFASDASGLPLGMQLVGSRFSDRSLLAVARWAAQAVLGDTTVAVVTPHPPAPRAMPPGGGRVAG